MQLRKLLTGSFFFISSFVTAQKITNISVNLYTDSLKKGTYNYINVDGLLSNGNYIPLDSAQIVFWASEGKFYGNELWIEKNFSKDKILIKVSLKQDANISKEFTMFIKKSPDNEKLKTNEELIKEMNDAKKIKRKYSIN
ncbi:MAG: hypothetical protein M3004_14625 [Bacteroidota bacterium]|nr:hypothetical protein [Bacteroidota bacterium]